MKINFKLLTSSEIKNVYGQEIRKYRDQLCYTQEFMARELGIGQSAYQKMESGTVKIAMERIIQIAKVLGKPVEVFIDGGESKEALNDKKININEKEWNLTRKIILQQEKRIEELEAKIQRRDDKIDFLKQQLRLS